MALGTRTAEACRAIRRGELLKAHRSVLLLASQARETRDSELPALALELQSSLTLLARAFTDAGFRVPPIAGNELAGVFSGSGTVAALVDEFDTRAHQIFNATGARRAHRPSAERIKAYMEANFHRGQTVTEIASVIGCSRDHIYDVFGATYGVSPSEYLYDLRLDYGENVLLKRPGVSLSEVATIAGFRSYDSFYRRFVERHGMAPSKFRKRRRPVSSVSG